MMENIDALIAFTGIILLASLLVTVITQIIVVILNLRGKNLLWGLSRLLKQIEPELGDKAKDIAKKILDNQFISRNKIRLPNVIRVEEFSTLLIQLAESDDIEEFDKNVQDALKDLVKYDPDEFSKLVKNLPASLVKATQKNLKKAQKEIFEQIKKARTKLTELEYWFDKMTDRISERFGLRSKIITVIGAIIVAGFLQLDSIQILKQVYSDSALRASLVAGSDFLIEKGSALLDKENVFDLSVASLLTKYPDLADPKKSFSNRMSVEKWIEENIPDNLSKGSVLEDYRNLLNETSKEHLEYLGNYVWELNKNLIQLQFKILGEQNKWEFWKLNPKRIPGILITIALLSLGAPFWFNILKNLTNLRTRLMQKEEKERIDRGENSKSGEA